MELCARFEVVKSGGGDGDDDVASVLGYGLFYIIDNNISEDISTSVSKVVQQEASHFLD
jgi:hypothetical protein